MKTHGLQSGVVLAGMALAAIHSAWAETDFIYVNGGYSLHSNSEMHEEDLLAFQKNIFRGRGEILNAAGPGTMTIKMSEYKGGRYVDRDALGSAQLRPTQVKGPFKSATIPHLEAAMGAIKENRATVVLGDHGGPDGAKLWDDTLTPKKYHELLGKVPVSTMVRSLHLHCFGGVMLKAEAGDPAPSPEKLPGYLARNYSPNRCGLSLSSPNEPAWYWNGWDQYLKKNPHTSLEGIKAYLRSNALDVSSMSLTSDVMAKDIFQVVCAPAASETTGAACASDAHDGSARLSGGIAGVARWLLCRPDSARELDHLEREIRRLSAVLDDFDHLKHRWARRFIEINWSKFSKGKKTSFKDYVARVEELERMNASEARESKTGGLTPEAHRHISALKRQLPVDYQLLVDGLEYEPGFMSYFRRGCTRDWLKDSRRAYPSLSAHLGAGLDTNGFFDVGTVQGEIYAAYKTVQERKKELTSDVARSRRLAAEAWLARPENAELRALYDGVRTCEKSALD